MFYFFYFFLLTFNMIFFGIINIPLFKYFCDLPTYDFLLENGDNNSFFLKNYFLSNYVEDLNSIYTIKLNSFFIDLDFFFAYFISSFFYIYFFNFDYYFNDFISSCDYIEVLFQTSTSNFNFIEFCTLQKYIYVIPNETHLIFFRMYNSVGVDITGISIYLIYPTDYLVYFNKIQCFCFEELLLYPYESIDLPVIFFVSNDILNNVDFFYSNKLYLSYLFLVR
jgi:cytochrome c oxidase assembly protein Cox11